MELKGKFVIEQINSIDCLRDFYCGIETMDVFIHGNFAMSIDNHFCKAYIVKNALDEILAMFALSFDSIDLDLDDVDDLQNGVSSAGTPELEPQYEDIFYSKRRYPALDIAYLAVNKNIQHKGLGKAIIQTIVKKATEQNFAGCQFLSVEALATKEYNAVGFYQKCGFSPLEYPNPNKDTLRMFKTLRIKRESNI